MDLEVVGRHALLFDDDANVAFVNSNDALVEWHSLQIDRYDVRHLLSGPPPPRRRNRNSERIISEDPFLESQLDHERYIDLPILSVTRVEGDGNPEDEGDYRAVAFSYGENDNLADQKKIDAEMEYSGFLPSFSIPGDLLQILPSTEKEHQIIARTAMFVGKHGGQSEIILRVKQGDNPTFGFLMPDHQLHPYFRFLVEHPELLHTGGDGESHAEVKNVDSKHCNANGIGGALSLLGSAYDSGEEEDGDENSNTEKHFARDSNNSVSSTTADNSASHGSMMENNVDVVKDVSVTRNTFPSIKDKVLSSKKNSLISASKSGGVKSIKKESKAGSFSIAAEVAKINALEGPSMKEPIISEPPPEFKILIDKLVEFIGRKGKQFEETLIEQDMKHGRFPFLRPSNQYHPYYLKVLQCAQESKTNGKFSYSGKHDLVGLGIDRKASLPKKNELSSLDSYVGDMPMESDMKEKFKMVIGKSKKEAQDTQPKEAQQECGITVDAAAAAAILQSAIRGINKFSRSEDNQPTSFGSRLPFQLANADQNGSSRTSPEAALESDSFETHLTEEQKVKAERLKRAKLFVAMLKSGTVRGSSMDPLESGVSMSASEVNLTGKEREGSLTPADVGGTVTVEKPEKICFGEEHSERLARRNYRSRSTGFEDDDEDNDGDKKKHIGKSRSRRQDQTNENENTEGSKQKRHRRRRQYHSSSEENENEGEIVAEDREHELSKLRQLSHHSLTENDGGCEYKDRELKDHKWSRKKHHSSRKRWHSPRQHSDEEDAHDIDGKDRKRSRKKHRSHHTSKRSEEKQRHRSRHSSRDKESRRQLEGGSSSDTLYQNHSDLDKCKRDLYDERYELEEGEISSKVSEESRGNARDRVSRETSIDALSSHSREARQPSETIADVPDDLRAKIRAMLMATRL